MKSCGIASTSFLVALFTLTTHCIKAQLSANDSVFYQKAVNNTKAIYHQSIGDQTGLYNGSQYAGYLFAFKDGGHPFFYKDDFLQGTIVYDNILHPEVKLKYDEVKEVIIFEDATHRIQLVGDRISRFSIMGNDFVRITKDTGKNALVSTGFYQMLYDGNITVLKKEVKSIREVLVSNTEGIYRYIDAKKYYYINWDNEYYAVKRKKSLLNLFKNRRKEVQQHIKRNKLNFKKDPDNFLIQTTLYYDQLIK
jgi:hypothetical protein